MKLKLTIFVAFIALILVCVGITCVVLNATVSPSEKCKNLLEEGAAAEIKHDPATAKKRYASAAAEARNADMPEALCKSLRKLAAIEIADGNVEDGISTLKKGLVASQAITGAGAKSIESHGEQILTERAKMLKDLCSALQKLNKFKEADEACVQAISISSEAHGPTDMQEGLMAEHQLLLEKMGRTDEAGQVAMSRFTTYRDFHECYVAGIDEYEHIKVEDAKRDLTVACATARRTHPNSRMSALTFLALCQFSMGETKEAQRTLTEADPLPEVRDGWPDERARYLVAKALDAAASGSDQQAEMFVSKAIGLKRQAAINALQKALWNTAWRDSPRDVCHAAYLISNYVCEKYLGSKPNDSVNMALAAARINLRPECSADFKTLIELALKAGRHQTLQDYVTFLNASYDQDCRNSEILLSTAESLKLVEPPNIDEEFCLQALIWQGRICRSKRDYDKAEKFFQRSISILQKYPVTPLDEHKSYYSDSEEDLASVYQAQNKISDAQRCLRDAWNNTTLRKHGAINEFYAWRACALVDFLAAHKRSAEAEHLAAQALATLAPFEETKDFNHRMPAELERRLASTEFDQGHKEVAIKHWQTATADFKREANWQSEPAGASMCEACIANAYGQMNNPKESAIWWQRSLNDVDLGTANGINAYLERSQWYSQVLQERKDFPGSETVINAAISQAEKHKNQVQPGKLAYLYRFLLRAQLQRNAMPEFEVTLDKARELYRQSIAGQPKQAPSQAASDQDSLAGMEAEGAAAYRDRQMYNQSESWWNRSIADSTTATQHDADGYLDRMLWYAQTLHQEKKNSQAKEIIDKALRLAQSLKQQNHDRVLANFYFLNGNIEKEQNAASASAPTPVSPSWRENCKQNFVRARDLFLRTGDKQSASACEQAIHEIGPV